MNPFKVLKTDPKSQARTGRLTIAHGEVQTPAFMPVGTQGTVKTLSVDELKTCGAKILLANVYHLMMRPGAEVIQAAGGLHRFMNWDGGLLTDSGGFQVFSLGQFRKITDEGVRFQSHIDGTAFKLTPESVMEFQCLLGSDVIVPLDECVRFPCERLEAEGATTRTEQWAKRSVQWLAKQERRHERLFFGIVQGATFPELRQRSAESLAALGVDGVAIGGLSVGEPQSLMLEMLEATLPHLPKEKPRYLMGVGEPLDLVESVIRGVDLFDCVVPTRHGRNGTAYTWEGKLNLRHAKHRLDPKPVSSDCDCFVCKEYSRSYLHHLLRAQELLVFRLLSFHNLWFYFKLMQAMRLGIQEGSLLSLRKRVANAYSGAINPKEVV